MAFISFLWWMRSQPDLVERFGGLGFGFVVVYVVIIGTPVVTLITTVGTIRMYKALKGRSQRHNRANVAVCALGGVFSILGIAVIMRMLVCMFGGCGP